MWKKKSREKKFSLWINSHHGAMYKHALWMTGNRDIATDLVQEAYYQAWNSIGTLKDDAYALSWLLSILRRCSYREYQTKIKDKQITTQLNIIETQKTKLEQYEIIDLEQAIQTLSKNHREILLLHYLHGFSYDEISKQLNIPTGTVMSRLSRAKDMLKKHFQVLT